MPRRLRSTPAIAPGAAEHPDAIEPKRHRMIAAAVRRGSAPAFRTSGCRLATSREEAVQVPPGQAADELDHVAGYDDADPIVADAEAVVVTGSGHFHEVADPREVGRRLGAHDHPPDALEQAAVLDLLYVPLETLAEGGLHGLARKARNTAARVAMPVDCPCRTASAKAKSSRTSAKT